MTLDDSGIHRAGLALVFRIIPVLVATILYGEYSLSATDELCSQNIQVFTLPYCAALPGDSGE